MITDVRIDTPDIKTFRVVTTDGKRLAKIEKNVDVKDSFSKVVVPPKILQEALKICNGDDKGDLKIGINEKEIFQH